MLINCLGLKGPVKTHNLLAIEQRKLWKVLVRVDSLLLFCDITLSVRHRFLEYLGFPTKNTSICVPEHSLKNYLFMRIWSIFKFQPMRLMI